MHDCIAEASVLTFAADMMVMNACAIEVQSRTMQLHRYAFIVRKTSVLMTYMQLRDYLIDLERC